MRAQHTRASHAPGRIPVRSILDCVYAAWRWNPAVSLRKALPLPGSPCVGDFVVRLKTCPETTQEEPVPIHTMRAYRVALPAWPPGRLQGSAARPRALPPTAAHWHGCPPRRQSSPLRYRPALGIAECDVAEFPRTTRQVYVRR